MRREFIKYQSLGNNFILFDWYKKPQVFIDKELASPDWRNFIISSCNRYTGVGADGVLILKRNPERMLHELLIFNNDGTQAQNCLNGTRSTADYLKNKYHISQKVDIIVGKRIIACTFDDTNNITMNTGQATPAKTQTISVDGQTYQGYYLDVGNFHFIVFQEISGNTLASIGQQIAHHDQLTHGANVEFVWENENGYQMIVYEHGAGMTQACSSGAAAIVGLLNQQKKVAVHDRTTIAMPGGTVTGWTDDKQNIFLTATAQKVFTGSF